MAADGARFSDAERGISERGTAPTQPLRLSQPPSISALPPGRLPSPAAQLAAFDEIQQLDDAAKEAWKADNPTWPLNAGLRFRSGFIFSDEEIRAGFLDIMGYMPGPMGLVATLLSLLPRVQAAMASGDPMEDMPWELVAQIVAQVLVAVAAKKLKLSEARALLTEAFKKFGVTQAVAQRAARLVLRIQTTANREIQKLAKQKGWKTLSSFTQGTKWHDAVIVQLKRISAEQARNKTGFWFTFDKHADNLLSLGSGAHHEGSTVDIMLHYGQKRLARIELKMSLGAISPHRTQTFMLVHDSLSIEMLHIYLTPTRMVLLPDVDGGVPVPIELLSLQ